MKFTKILFTLLTLSFCTASYASFDPNTSTREEIQLMMQDVDFKLESTDKILVNFMINTDNKLIIVSTDSKTNDEIIRSSLNLKSINSIDLELNKIYTIPIQLKKM